MSEADEATPPGAPSASTGPPAAPKRPGASAGRESPQAAAADRVDADAVPRAAEAAGSDAAEPKVILARRMTGTVKWFNVKEGYGFISRSDTHGDVFVHQSAISRNNPLKYRRSVGEGETVEFDLVQSERGAEAAEVTGPAGSAVEGSRYARDRPRPRRHPTPAPGPPGSDPDRPDQQADGGRARLSPGSPGCRRARARGPQGREHPGADGHPRAPADHAPCHRGAHGHHLAPADHAPCHRGAHGHHLAPDDHAPCHRGAHGHHLAPADHAPCHRGAHGHHLAPDDHAPCHRGAHGHHLAPDDHAPCHRGAHGHHIAPVPALGPRGREHPEEDGHPREPADHAPCHRGAHGHHIAPVPALGPRGREHPEEDGHPREPADHAPCHRGAHGHHLAPAPARGPRGAEDTDEDQDAADHPRAPHSCQGQRRVTYRCAHRAKGPQAARDDGAADTERPLCPQWAIATGRCPVSSCGTESAQHRDLDEDQAPQDNATLGCSSDVRCRAAPRGARWPSDRGADQAAAAESRHYPRAFTMRPRGRTQRPAVAAKAEPVAHAGGHSFTTAQGPRGRAPDKAHDQPARRCPPARRPPAEPRRPRPAGGPRAPHHPWPAAAAGPPRGGPGPAPARNSIPGRRGSASTSQKPEARVVGSCWDTGTLQCIPLLRYGPSACRGLRCRPQSPPEAQVRDPKRTEDEIQARPAEPPASPSEEQSASSEGPTSTLAAE